MAQEQTEEAANMRASPVLISYSSTYFQAPQSMHEAASAQFERK
jgi:hypothetical protein